MHSYAKLILGSTYMLKGQIFERGVELPVDSETADYLETVSVDELISEGNNWSIRPLKRFAIRKVELTDEEKVEADVAEVPDNLKLTKPGRKPAA